MTQLVSRCRSPTVRIGAILASSCRRLDELRTSGIWKYDDGGIIWFRDPRRNPPSELARLLCSRSPIYDACDLEPLT